MSGQEQNYQAERDLNDSAQKTNYTVVKCVGSLWRYDMLQLNRWVNEVNHNVEQYLKMFHRTHIDMIVVFMLSQGTVAVSILPLGHFIISRQLQIVMEIGNVLADIGGSVYISQLLYT